MSVYTFVCLRTWHIKRLCICGFSWQSLRTTCPSTTMSSLLRCLRQQWVSSRKCLTLASLHWVALPRGKALKLHTASSSSSNVVLQINVSHPGIRVVVCILMFLSYSDLTAVEEDPITQAMDLDGVYYCIKQWMADAGLIQPPALVLPFTQMCRVVLQPAGLCQCV